MNRSFGKTITALRKEKNLSQKQASQELGISQALLSHYEKGIRECSLDFVCKLADYYDVSADYLLGRSRDRYTIASDGSSDSAQNPTAPTPSMRLQVNTLSVIYHTLGKISNRRLTRNISQLLMLTEYRILRALYRESAGEGMLFSADKEHYQGYTLSSAVKLITDIEAQCAALSKEEASKMRTAVSADEFSDEFPDDSGAALNVISHAEAMITKIK